VLNGEQMKLSDFAALLDLLVLLLNEKKQKLKKKLKKFQRFVMPGWLKISL
jgi:hypothetical protein